MKNLVCHNALNLAAATLLLLAAAGCGRDDIKVYKVDASESVATTCPAVTPDPMPATMPDGLAMPDNSNQPKLKYTLPDGWKEKPLTQMRVASFTVTNDDKSAEVSVIPLGGMSGGDAANVNRWRGQIDLSQIADEAVKKSAEAVEIAGQPGALYDLLGTGPCSGEPERILGAILHGEDTVWYFKMTGDAGLVENQKANFIAFLKSVEFQKMAAPTTLDFSQLPPSHPAIPGLNSATQTAPATDVAAKPTWTVPADWKEGPLAKFLVAKFIIQNGDVTAAVNASQLSGDGGGLLPNINRWRGQLGQPPLIEDVLANLPTIDANGGKATVVEIVGTDPRSGQPASLVGVVLPHNGQTWFYKLMGDPDIVAQQKDAFIKFIQSAKYPDAH